MASASKLKGYVKPPEWWKHLKWGKRVFNKRVRKDGKRQIKEQRDG